jgi:hypothetical protein
MYCRQSKVEISQNFVAFSDYIKFMYSAVYNPRTTDTQRELFFKNLKFLGLGRRFRRNLFEEFGVFSARLKVR